MWAFPRRHLSREAATTVAIEIARIPVGVPLRSPQGDNVDAAYFQTPIGADAWNGPCFEFVGEINDALQERILSW